MARIAVDMDEVMADTLTEHLRRYNRDFGEDVTKEDLTGKWLWQVIPPERHERLAAYLDEPSFFLEIPVMPDAIQVLQRLTKDHEIFVASAAMEIPHSFRAKFEWLQRHFAFLSQERFVFCGTKSILHADFLIDDNPRQLRAFTGKGLLFSSPHNLGVDHPEWPRLDGWEDVDRYFNRAR